MNRKDISGQRVRFRVMILTLLLSFSTFVAPTSSFAASHSAPKTALPIQVSTPGAKYVALGSSYASGPGIAPVTDAGCGRSGENYASRVARFLGYALVDRTCSGARTDHILHTSQSVRGGAQVPPQIEAVTADTKLVTVTVGGNDVRYMTRILADSKNGAPVPEPTMLDYAKVEGSLVAIVGAIRLRAPGARVVLVDYLPLVSRIAGGCAAAPLNAPQTESAIRVHQAVADATARAAGFAGADLVQASRIGAGHAVCTADPWVSGFQPRPGDDGAVRYHVTARGMRAVAQQIVRQIG
ncbi:SGNH/GDSL hydrolase family protein [Rhodococcus sp. NPDC058521]|uniref:SGNH/GDSL hydrolase family protein n=1 Tax=Rhodococcus sp. NPDC058521 TaxID=3346536 RepID=UPI00364B5438